MAGFRVSGPWPSMIGARESGPLIGYSALPERACQHRSTALREPDPASRERGIKELLTIISRCFAGPICSNGREGRERHGGAALVSSMRVASRAGPTC